MPKDNKNKFILSITESPSRFQDLEKMPVHELISSINKEDAQVHAAVRKALPQIEKLVTCIIDRMKKGGRVNTRYTITLFTFSTTTAEQDHFPSPMQLHSICVKPIQFLS